MILYAGFVCVISLLCRNNRMCESFHLWTIVFFFPFYFFFFWLIVETFFYNEINFMLNFYFF